MARRWSYFAEEVDGEVKVGRNSSVPYPAKTPQAALDNLIPNLIKKAGYHERRANDCRKAVAAIHLGEVTRTWETKRK